MPRWDPGAEGRLLQAAMELFLDRGYEQVTVAEIAERAGLTKRSFFRYYADKREVLFGGAADFQQGIVDRVVEAPAGSSPLDAVVAALTEAGAGLAGWGQPVLLRQRVIDSSTELQERELIKFTELTAATAAALARRGVDELTAHVAARVGMAVFVTAWSRWAATGNTQPFPDLMADSLRRVRDTVAAPPEGAQSSSGTGTRERSSSTPIP